MVLLALMLGLVIIASLKDKSYELFEQRRNR
jgi:hypothetical protein